MQVVDRDGGALRAALRDRDVAPIRADRHRRGAAAALRAGDELLALLVGVVEDAARARREDDRLLVVVRDVTADVRAQPEDVARLSDRDRHRGGSVGELRSG